MESGRATERISERRGDENAELPPFIPLVLNMPLLFTIITGAPQAARFTINMPTWLFFKTHPLI
jgi:hypothetical protein